MGFFSNLFSKKEKSKEAKKSIHENALESKEKFEGEMNAKNISFFEAVWNYFLKIGALNKFKEEYISQLDLHILDDNLKELSNAQIELVKSAFKNKLGEIKTNKYDNIFEKVFKEEVRQNIEMSAKYETNPELKGFVLGGMTPDGFLEHLLNSSDGALFFFEPSITWENNKPLIKLDIDSGLIDWQPFG